MRSNIQVLISASRQAHREAVELSGLDHTGEQMKQLLIDLGSEVELFLKKCIFKGAHNRWSFEKLIDELANLGVDQITRTHLHDLRKEYNLAKHETTYPAPIAQVIGVLAKSKTALLALETQHLAESDAPSIAVHRRVLWFAVWDHYIGGDSEFSLFLPLAEDVGFPRSLDIFYVDMTRWEDIKIEMGKIGIIQFGRGSVPDNFYDVCSREGEFLDAGSFEGDYRELLQILANHEKVEDILPFLKRENDLYSMFAAVMMASVDAMTQPIEFKDSSDLSHQIAALAANNYAAPRHSAVVQNYSRKAANLIINCPLNLRMIVKGPIWTSVSRFNQISESGVSRMEDANVLISEDARMIVGI